jgi:serine/threonine-protein kinase
MNNPNSSKPARIGRYIIENELGRGGMAVVFTARDPYIKRKVAVKVLPRQLTMDPQFRARFQQEAEVIATLEHAFIVPIYDFGEDDHRPFIVMRLMTGGTLGERIERGPLPLANAATIIARIGAALDLAHREGIIHRDLKPNNILFSQHDEAFLSDFGVARLVEGNDVLTRPGDFVGTPAYMSPEQANGEAAIGPPSDIYALGVTLFQMLSGQLPYQSPTPMGLLMKHISDPVPNIRDINTKLPPGCEAIVARTLAKAPRDRYPTARELALDLARLASGSRTRGLETPPPGVTALMQASPSVARSGIEPPAPGPPAATPAGGPGEEADEQKAHRLILELDDPAKYIFARYALKDMGPVAIQPLISMILGQHKASLRCQAITILGEFCQEQGLKPLMKARAVKALATVLADPEVSIRYRSVKALSVFSGKQGQVAVEPLAELLSDPDQHVRQEARETLKVIGGKRAQEILRQSGGRRGWL